MLAFAKDITEKDPRHPDEDNQSKLKDYMDYQRRLDHEKLIYHSLDHGKTYLQKTINDERGDAGKIKKYLRQAFPVSCTFADSGTLMLMLRKLINAHNESNSWYRLNAFYFSVVLDCMERFTRVYNRLVREAPEKALEYKISEGVEVDFDDWVRLYFHDLDFMVGKPLQQPHFTFRKRNQAVEAFVKKEQAAGVSRGQAMESAREKFNIEPDAIKAVIGKPIDEKDLELLFTSAENPIYEYLYDINSDEGFLDGESLLDHAYFLGHQLKGLSFEEAETIVSDIEKLSKN